MLIAVYGPKQSGKGAISDVLVARGFHPVAFADALRDAAAAAYGLARDEFRAVSSASSTKEVPLDELDGRTPREVLGRLGMFFRDLDVDHWVRRAMAAARDHENVVFTDCRFPSEVEAVRAAGGVIVGVRRPLVWNPAEYSSDPAEDTVYRHWDRSVDVEVVNVGDLEALERTALRLPEMVPRFEVGRFVGLRGRNTRLLILEANSDGTFTCEDLGRRTTGTFDRSELMRVERCIYTDEAAYL